jgi:hypothetical protein
MHLILRQLTGNSEKKSNDDVFSKTGGENVVLFNLKLLLHISIVNSNHSYINHFLQISHRRSEINIISIATYYSALKYAIEYPLQDCYVHYFNCSL